jgi:hypothetical protein
MKKIVILVSSFDGFSDCWEPFLYGFKKYWNNCEHEIFLITNELNSPDESTLKSIKVGNDQGWASNMIKALESIDCDYIIYLQEDYWLNEFVNQKYLSSILNRMFKYDWDYFRLVPIPGPEILIEDDQYGLTTSDSKYQLCLQAAIWKKKLLKSLLVEGESGWDFETKSTDRIKNKKVKSFSISKDKANSFILSYCEGTAIRKGKWTRGAEKFINNENLNFNLTKRKMESR